MSAVGRRSESLPTLRVLARPAYRNRAKLPYNGLLYDAVRSYGVEVAEWHWRRIVGSTFSIVHVHWPESLLDVRTAARARLSALSHLMLLDIARARGARLVWTVHDLEPHDFVFEALERRFLERFVARVDAVIGLSAAGLNAAHGRWPALSSRPSFIVPHGHFREAYPRTLDRKAARAALAIPESALVVAAFGQIRPYKNFPRLIEIFRAVAPPHAMLVIAGRLNSRAPHAAQLVDAARGDPRIQLRLEFIPNQEVEFYLMSADLLVCPFADILNSGSVILGLSFDRRVLAPRIGAMDELAREVGPDWLRLYDGPLDGPVLTGAMRWAQASPAAGRPSFRHREWSSIGARTIEAYREIVRCRRGRRGADGSR